MGKNINDIYYSRGLVETHVTVVDVYGDPVDRPHAWEIHAQRNLGGAVMFVRDGNPYYVDDCDVYWFEDD